MAINKYIDRTITPKVLAYLENFPAVAILGPRQVGKSTLAKNIVAGFANAIYLDLELASDRQKLTNPEIFFERYKNKLICLDEIQRAPELFTSLRGIIDKNDQNGQFIILGSASPDLIRQSSESLAGRIAFVELAPFLFKEVENESGDVYTLWLRGGFPRSYLANSDELSLVWRENFVQTFLERDIPQLGFRIASETLGRLWRMCSHMHGQLVNLSNLGQSLGMSHTTVRSYLELLSHTFMIRLLSPFSANLKKRLVRSPKLYIRDSGILHALLGLETFEELMGHHLFGASWEGMALEHTIQTFPRWSPTFYRTSDGTELDLVLEKANKRFVFEFKASKAPELTRGFWNSIEQLKPQSVFIIAPIDDAYKIEKNITIAPLSYLTTIAEVGM
ncbi:ATP-binding protein [candidate division KSB1 bacterium]|nr:ATP-binding protein [candidate division KSB1 bacterium]RQW01971.1 MAG: ATP-binding protein [candidate division KSB1 bacterium]